MEKMCVSITIIEGIISAVILGSIGALIGFLVGKFRNKNK